jgi:hypothetical protein
MAQALGYTAEQMAGRRADEFLYAPDPDLRREIQRLIREGTGCRATTCYRHGVTGAPLWITIEMAPMAPSAPDLVLVTLQTVEDTGSPQAEIVPGSTNPTAKVRALDLDVGMMLHRQIADLYEIIDRQAALRGVVQNAMRLLLTEDRPATTTDDRLRDLEERLDRLLALVTTAGLDGLGEVR